MLRNVVVYHVATQMLSIPTANVLVAIQLKGWVHTLTGLDRLHDNMLCNPVEREKRHKVHVRAHTHIYVQLNQQIEGTNHGRDPTTTLPSTCNTVLSIKCALMHTKQCHQARHPRSFELSETRNINFLTVLVWPGRKFQCHYPPNGCTKVLERSKCALNGCCLASRRCWSLLAFLCDRVVHPIGARATIHVQLLTCARVKHTAQLPWRQHKHGLPIAGNILQRKSNECNRKQSSCQAVNFD